MFHYFIIINNSTMFPVTKVYSDNNGNTRFEDISIPLRDAGKIGKLSEGDGCIVDFLNIQRFANSKTK